MAKHTNFDHPDVKKLLSNHSLFVEASRESRLRSRCGPELQDSIEKNRALQYAFEKHHNYWVPMELTKEAKETLGNREALQELMDNGKLLQLPDWAVSAFKELSFEKAVS